MDHEDICALCAVRRNIRDILASDRAPTEKLRAVRLALDPPTPLPPIQVTDRGWPVLTAAWDRRTDSAFR